MRFDVSIIIINYNSEKYTIDCINSFLKHTSKRLTCQYIIVDNASQKKSYFKLKTFINSIAKIINIELIRSHINTGFGGGNMLGVKKAIGNYLAFVNNDILLKNDCLSILKAFMDTEDQAGICGPQAYKDNGDILPTIDHFASLKRELLGRKFLECINPKKYPKRNIQYKNPQRGQFVAGSFMFLLKKDFDAIGGFDSNIFLYYEETDLCKRLLKLNKYAYVVPKGKFLHFHGASTTKSVAIKTELKISLLYVIKKHYGVLSYYILLNYLRLKYFFSSLVKPKYWTLFFVLIKGASLSESIKHEQNIEPF